MGAQSSRFRRPWWSPRLGTAIAVFGGASCGCCGVTELNFPMQILEQCCQELYRFRGRNCLRFAGETSGLLRGDGTSPLQCYHANTSQQKMDPTQSTARGLCSRAHRLGPSARELGRCFGTCVQRGVTSWQRPASDGCGLRYPQGDESGSLNLGGLTGNLCMVTIMDSVTSFPLVIYDRKCAPRKHKQTGPSLPGAFLLRVRCLLLIMVLTHLFAWKTHLLAAHPCYSSRQHGRRSAWNIHSGPHARGRVRQAPSAVRRGPIQNRTVCPLAGYAQLKKVQPRAWAVGSLRWRRI